MDSLEGPLARVRVVLVDPTYDGNLGQVARAMRNFGLSRLYLVGGKADPDSDEARWYGREEGGPILDAAVRTGTLREAIADCRRVIGTSRRLGRKRGPFRTPEETWAHAEPWAQSYDTALLFGREAHGLSTDELDLCSDLLWIPSDPKCPSLNLSHSVSVLGYTLAMATRAALEREPRIDELEPATADEVQGMFDHARRVWLRIGYLHYQNPDAILRTWRKIFGRTRLSEYEVRVVRSLVHQTEWVAKVAGIPPGGVLDAPEGLFDKHKDWDEPFRGASDASSESHEEPDE